MQKHKKQLGVIGSLLLLALLFNLPAGSISQAAPLSQGTPPYSGTIFLDPDIITPADPTTFQNVVYAGQGSRMMFDRRVDAFITVNAYLFNASFNDGLSAEIQVNPEFGSSAAAMVEAQKYGPIIGQLPTVLRTDVKTVWIHMGTQPFGGGNNNLLIHTGQTDLYVADGILEETLIHEAAHTSLDAAHATAAGWLAAQTTDGNFISTYARDNPNREDVAESFLPWLALRHRLDRIDQTYIDTVSQTIPNRLTYFDNQPFNMYPISIVPVAITKQLNASSVLTSSARITYSITIVNNNSTQPLTNTTVSDMIPMKTTYIPGSATASPNLVTFTNFPTSTQPFTLPTNSSVTLTYALSVSTVTKGEILSNTATLSAPILSEVFQVTRQSIVDPEIIYLPIIVK